MVEKNIVHKSGAVFTAVVTKEEDWYVAECMQLGIASQGKTVEEAIKNIKEATELYLEEFPEHINKASHFSMTVTFEVFNHGKTKIASSASA